jgi:hypothetical protein
MTFLKVASHFFDGCETWTVTVMEERILQVFGNKVLREIFGP